MRQVLKLHIDRTILYANGEDLAFITVSVVEKKVIGHPTRLTAFQSV